MANLLKEMAFGVHTSLTIGHTLAAYYNYRKAKRVDGWVAFHVVAAILDANAIRVHLKRVKELKCGNL